jgi:hypothetical protein
MLPLITHKPSDAYVRMLAGILMLTGLPSVVWAAGEAAEVSQMFQTCVNSGGRAASNYNAWVAQNGCICPGSSTGSGQRTCSGASGSSPNPGSSGDLMTDSSKNVVQGMMNGNQQQMGVGMMGVGAAVLIQGLQDNPEDDARKQAEAMEQARQAQLRRAEGERNAEESRNRLLGELMDTDTQATGKVATSETPAAGQPVVSGLPLMTDDISPSAPIMPAKPDPNPLPGKPKSNAFKKGYQAASQCFSSSAGTYCNIVPAEQLQSCVADYNGGYSTGKKHLAVVMKEAFDAGNEDGMKAEPVNGASDPRAEGPCRVTWIETYNSGYFQGSHKK